MREEEALNTHLSLKNKQPPLLMHNGENTTLDMLSLK